jgi:hypothetical protein
LHYNLNASLIELAGINKQRGLKKWMIEEPVKIDVPVKIIEKAGAYHIMVLKKEV